MLNYNKLARDMSDPHPIQGNDLQHTLGDTEFAKKPVRRKWELGSAGVVVSVNEDEKSMTTHLTHPDSLIGPDSDGLTKELKVDYDQDKKTLTE